MKLTATLLVFVVMAMNLQAQIFVREQTQITTPVKVQTTSSPQVQIFTGKDVSVRIDRIVDNSTLDLSKYTVHYSLINSGTEIVNISQLNFKIVGTFLAMNNSFMDAGGTVFTNTLGRTTLNSGEIVQTSMTVQSARLFQNVTYKLKLEILAESRNFNDVSRLNNVSETTVTARSIRNADYYLTSVKVAIHTGNDNKEANNSRATIYVGPANHNDRINYTKETYEELKINSTTVFTLDCKVSTLDLYGPYNSLCFYKNRGLAVTIIYDNTAWATDAWKINGITVTLEFKDKNGNPYPNPAIANITISYPQSEGLLGYRAGDDIAKNANQIRVMAIGTDQFFNPLPAEFKRYVIPLLNINNSPLKNAAFDFCK